MEAEANRSRKAEAERQRLVTKGDVLRVINSDEVMKMIRFYAKSRHDRCLDALLDPKLTSTEQTMLLKGEAQAHKAYMELFDVWEREGRESLKKILEMEKAGKNGGVLE